MGHIESISVVIPTCGRPALLQRALASVAAQRLPPIEILVVDDAAATAGAVDAAGLAAVARVVVNTRAQGPSGARNTGAAAARGALLAFLDDDDEWLPDYLAHAAARVAAQGLDALCTDLLYCTDDGAERRAERAPEELDAGAFLTRNPGLIGSNLLIRSAVYAALGGFDESLRTSEDMDFGLRLSLQKDLRYAALHEPLGRHHQHTQPRLCTRRGEAMRAGVRRFFALHGARMSPAQRDEYRANVRRLWGVDEYGRDPEAQ
jgi:glycosyltransferase involved in cell wall biosynthesis